MKIMKKILVGLVLITAISGLTITANDVNPVEFEERIEAEQGGDNFKSLADFNALHVAFKTADEAIKKGSQAALDGLYIAVEAIPSATMFMLSAGAEFTSAYPYLATALIVPTLYVTYKLCQGTNRVLRSISRTILG